MEDKTIENLETLIAIKEKQRLVNKLKDWKVKELKTSLFIKEYNDKLEHQIEIHNMVLARLQERFNKILHNLTINN